MIFIAAVCLAALPASTTLSLENGATVLASANPQAKQFSITVAFRGGSASDPAKQHGLHHLLEHALFLGPGDARLPEADFAAELYGCSLNATTYRDLIVLSCEGPATQWKRGIAAVQSLLREPPASDIAIQKEIEIIREELALQRVDAKRKLIDDVWLLGCKSVAHAKPTGGTLDEMTTIKSAELVNAFPVRFSGSNCFAAITAPVDAARELAVALSSLKRGVMSEFVRFEGAIAGRHEVADSLTGVGFDAPGLMDTENYAAFLVLLEFVQLGALSSFPELEVSFGPSATGSLFVCTAGFSDEKRLRAVLLSICSGTISVAQFEIAKQAARAKFRANEGLPHRWVQKAAFMSAFGVANFSADNINGISLEKLKVAASRLDPAAGVWVVPKL